MVRNYFIIILLLNTALLFSYNNVVILPFTGQDGNVPVKIEKSFIEEIKKSQYLNITKKGQLNTNYYIKGFISKLGLKYYLTVTLLDSGNDQIILSKRSKGFYPINITSSMRELVMNITLETGIRKNPPSLLNPNVIDIDYGKKQITGDIGFNFFDIFLASSVKKGMLFNINGDNVSSTYEVIEVYSDSFVAKYRRGDRLNIGNSNNLSMSFKGKRVPFSLTIGAGAPLSLAGIQAGIDLHYMFSNGVGFYSGLDFIQYFSNQNIGFSNYITFMPNLYDTKGFRFGAGFSYTNPKSWLTNLDEYSFYPSILLQFVAENNQKGSFTLKYRYIHFPDSDLIYSTSILGLEPNSVLRGSILEASVLIRPFY